jgi:amino acid transporter
MARLFYYGSVCAALPVLRRKAGISSPLFHLPLGNMIAGLAVGTSLLLFPKLDRPSLIVLGIVAVCVVLNVWWAKRHSGTSSRRSEQIS